MNITEILYVSLVVWGLIGFVVFVSGGAKDFIDSTDDVFDKTLDRERKITSITNFICVVMAFGPIIVSFVLLCILAYFICKFAYNFVYWLVSKFVK